MNKRLLITPLVALVAAAAEPVTTPNPAAPAAAETLEARVARARARDALKPVVDEEGAFTMTPVKDTTGLTFPPKIPGDDFDGTPHLIVFTKSAQRSFKKLCPNSAYGFGTPDDPLRTYARVYYRTTKEGTTYELKTDLKAKDLGTFPINKASNKTSLLKSINASMIFPVSNIAYGDILKSIHKDCEALQWPMLQSAEALQKHRTSAQHPGGTMAILAAIRINIGKQNIMSVFTVSNLDDEKMPTYRNKFFIFDNGWKLLSVTRAVNGAGPDEFQHLFNDHQKQHTK